MYLSTTPPCLFELGFIFKQFRTVNGNFQVMIRNLRVFCFVFCVFFGVCSCERHSRPAKETYISLRSIPQGRSLLPFV